MITEDINDPSIFYWRGSTRYVKLEWIQYLIRHNLLANPMRGGLVLGPLHDDGGIQMIRKVGDEYAWVGEMEGYEYVVNTFGTQKHNAKLVDINGNFIGFDPMFEPYEVPSNIRIIDCQPLMIGGLLTTKWLAMTPYSQWIVNKVSTRLHLAQIDEINSKTWRLEPEKNAKKASPLKAFFRRIFR